MKTKTSLSIVETGRASETQAHDSLAHNGSMHWAASKAWAGKVAAHLDQLWSKMTWVIHLDRMAAQLLRLNKSCAGSFTETLAPTTFSPSLSSFLCHTRLSEATASEQNKESNNTIVGPITGARTHRWVDISPSSGISAKPYPCAPPQI
jgi:hypothetical protein